MLDSCLLMKFEQKKILPPVDSEIGDSYLQNLNQLAVEDQEDQDRLKLEDKSGEVKNVIIKTSMEYPRSK